MKGLKAKVIPFPPRPARNETRRDSAYERLSQPEREAVMIELAAEFLRAGGDDTKGPKGGASE
jgi:hypothetical protein